MSDDVPEEQLLSWIDRDAPELEEYLAKHPEHRTYVEEHQARIKDIHDGANLASMPPPQEVGPYVVRRFLGQGGFGVVYLAEQQRPLQRLVALKLIKPGMDSRAVIARFEAERQALALMNHSNVAKVFDAGATEHGRPYFVMEHVAGVPITVHCDRGRLGIGERLNLFIQVCEGVQHAHQKGVIHRDLKPGNILVAIQDGKAVPKVIDFGVAKAISQPLTEETIFTEQGQRIGTPPYMSPEQTDTTAQDIDTRTDVYSLGAVLYELLTGAPPLDLELLRQAGFDKTLRIIREVEPPKPSAKLSGMITAGDDDSTTTARNRRADPRTLVRLLRGDLDWITMKALEKDRTRRYASPLELAADIRRHLRHEPVVAGPPGAGYRIGKFARRNRALVTGSAAVLAVLLAGVAVSSWQAVRATRERNRAVAAEQVTSRIMSFLLDDMLGAMEPYRVGGTDVTVREVLDEASARLRTQFIDQPQIEAAMRETIGEAYNKLGLYDEAEPHMRKALEIRRNLWGDEHPAVARSLTDLAMVYCGKGDYQTAGQFFSQSLAMWRRLKGEDSLEVAYSLLDLARLHHTVAVKAEEGYSRAQPYYNQALETHRRAGGDPLGEAEILNSLANLLRAAGDLGEAERMHRVVLEIRRRHLPGNHPLLGATLMNLAALLREAGRPDEAETCYREALHIYTEALGEDHQEVAGPQLGLGLLLVETGDPQQAEFFLRNSLAIWQETLPEDHPLTAEAKSVLAQCLTALEKYDEAESLVIEGYRTLRKVNGEHNVKTQQALDRIVALYEAWGKPEKAAEYRALRAPADQPNSSAP